MDHDPDQMQSPPSADRTPEYVAWTVRAGVALACVGLLDGLIMALKRKVAPCPDGTYFPENATDFDCYVHPQAGVGIAIMVVSVLLAILIVLAGVIARAVLEARESS